MNVTIAGLPVVLYYDANGFAVRAEFQTVTINGAPLIVDFDPPIGPLTEFSFPAMVNAILMNALVAAILAGAMIG